MASTKGKQSLNILLADDGSEHSQAAVNLISDLPLSKESHITAMAIFTPRQIDSHLALQANLEKTQKQLQEIGFKVDIELKAGSPAETLIAYADKIQPDLMVLGAKGLRAILGILLGGVAQQVVEYARWPVLIVRAPYKGIRNVLLVTDGLEYSKRAVEYSGSFPFPSKTSVEIMHVLSPLPPSEFVVQSWPLGAEPLPTMPIARPTEEIKVWQKEEEHQGQVLLDHAVDVLAGMGVEAKSILVRGDAATEIINFAKKNKIDLIICGSRGLSQVRSWLLGSVSRKLIHYAGCSVLVVRGATK